MKKDGKCKSTDESLRSFHIAPGWDNKLTLTMIVMGEYASQWFMHWVQLLPCYQEDRNPAWLNEEIVGAAGHCTYPNTPKLTPHRFGVPVCRSTKTVPPAAGVLQAALHMYLQLWQLVDLHQTWTMDFSTMRTILWDARFIQVKLFTKQKLMSSTSVVILYILKHSILMNNIKLTS